MNEAKGLTKKFSWMGRSSVSFHLVDWKALLFLFVEVSWWVFLRGKQRRINQVIRLPARKRIGQLDPPTFEPLQNKWIAHLYASLVLTSEGLWTPWHFSASVLLPTRDKGTTAKAIAPWILSFLQNRLSFCNHKRLGEGETVHSELIS